MIQPWHRSKPLGSSVYLRYINSDCWIVEVQKLGGETVLGGFPTLKQMSIFDFRRHSFFVGSIQENGALTSSNKPEKRLARNRLWRWTPWRNEDCMHELSLFFPPSVHQYIELHRGGGGLLLSIVPGAFVYGEILSKQKSTCF